MTATMDVDEQGANFTSVIHSDTYAAISTSKHDGRSACVTGAAQGIGKAIALSLARSGAAMLALADRSAFSDAFEAEMLSAASDAGKPAPKLLLLQMDVTDAASVNAACARVRQELGRLDLLVNNAGYMAPYVALLDADAALEQRCLGVNVQGPINVTRALLPLLLDTADGLKTVVNTCSIGALAPRAGGGVYRSSKTALLRWTECLAIDYESAGLLAFCIHPGGIKTELASVVPEQLHSTLNDSPALTGDTLAFLTQQRRDWLAGRYVSCTWDMPELLSRKDEILRGSKLKMRMVF